MTDTLVARRYADALFSLAEKQSAEARDAYGAMLGELGRLVVEEPRLGAALKSPLIGVEEKKAVLAAILEKLDADRIFSNFCKLLADKNRLAELPGIADWYGILLDNARGIMRGKVITAIALTPEKQQNLKNSLERKANRHMELEFAVDPEILGGLVLAVGDKVLDTSLRAQLGALGAIMKRGK